MNNIWHDVIASARLVVKTVKIHFGSIVDIDEMIWFDIGRTEQKNGRQSECQQDSGKERLLPESDGQRQQLGTAPLGVVVVNENHFCASVLLAAFPRNSNLHLVECMYIRIHLSFSPEAVFFIIVKS